MGAKPRAKMPPSQRAKQFAPFAGLAGFETALRIKEEEMEFEKKRELLEETVGDIDGALAELKEGDTVTAEYWSEGRVVKISGNTARNSPEEQVLRIGGTDIRYEDLYVLRISDTFRDDK